MSKSNAGSLAGLLPLLLDVQQTSPEMTGERPEAGQTQQRGPDLPTTCHSDEPAAAAQSCHLYPA